jgi:hypothetical protein
MSFQAMTGLTRPFYLSIPTVAEWQAPLKMPIQEHKLLPQKICLHVRFSLGLLSSYHLMSQDKIRILQLIIGSTRHDFS